MRLSLYQVRASAHPLSRILRLLDNLLDDRSDREYDMARAGVVLLLGAGTLLTVAFYMAKDWLNRR
jgi:hypothetical protein